MPDRSHFDRWYSLGRLLPRDVRERVFDPALSDLVYEWLVRGPARRSAPFGVYAVGTYLGCLPTSTVRLFVRGGRLTRLGRASVWTVSIVTVVALVLMSMTERYATYGP